MSVIRRYSMLSLLLLAACGGQSDPTSATRAAQGAPVPQAARQGAAPAFITFAGKVSQYSIAANADGYAVTDSLSGQVTQVAAGSRLRFADNAVALDLDGKAGSIYRLYQATFNRKPDLAGLGYHLDTLDNGALLVDVATSFIASKEFSDLYGQLSNRNYVVQLYRNVLQREPDEPGVLYHLGYLEGTHPDHIVLTRAQTLLNFSDAPENKQLVLPAIAAGIEYIPWGTPATPQLFPQVQAIVTQRCVTCHSAHPTQPGFNTAPRGITFDSEAQIRSRAAQIRSTAVQSQFMPYGNATGMTQAERDVLGAWFNAGTP